MNSSLSKFNIRLLVIHFIAFWFFIYGFQTLAFLYDFNFLLLAPVEARLNDVLRVNSDMKVVALFSIIGLVIAYLISWRISLKRNWFWLNSVLIFIIAYVLKTYDLLGWNFLQKIFLLPGQIFRLNTRTFYVTNSFIMLAIGSYLLFSNKIKSFIDKGSVTDKKVSSVQSAKS